MFRTTAKLALIAAAMGLAACESSTGPDSQTQFDAEGALNDYEAMDAILSTDGMDGFRALGGVMGFAGVAPEGAAAASALEALQAPRSRQDAREMARLLLETADQLAPGTFRDQIISNFNRGKTFAYDSELGRYAHDPDRTDAPATGVRFILYEAGFGGKPNPEAEIGYADLIDEGDDSAEDVALRFLCVQEGTTLLDYRTTLDILDEGGTITVDGFLQGDGERLDFDIQVEGTEGDDGDSFDLSFNISIDTRDFLVQGTVSGVEDDLGSGGEIDIFVQHGNDSFQVDVTGTPASIDGTFYLNGELFATVTGDPDDPTFTDAFGDPLTGVEFLVLHRIVDMAEDVLDFWEDLMDPVDELVILAIIL